MPAHTRLLCFYLEDPARGKRGNGAFEDRSRAIIIGPQLTPVTLDLGKKYLNMIVMFKPCGLYRLLGIPLKEILDLDLDASLLLGYEINDVVDKLMNADSSDQKNSIIQTYLLERSFKLKPAHPIDIAMLTLVRTQGNLSMDSLASQCCLSVRQLERQSIERIGLSPKFFARIIRFSEAYKFKEGNPQTSWTDIGYRFGFYDQMHLIRDFRYFTGVNPSMFKEAEIVNSVKFNSLMPNIYMHA